MGVGNLFTKRGGRVCCQDSDSCFGDVAGASDTSNVGRVEGSGSPCKGLDPVGGYAGGNGVDSSVGMTGEGHDFVRVFNSTKSIALAFGSPVGGSNSQPGGHSVCEGSPGVNSIHVGGVVNAYSPVSTVGTGIGLQSGDNSVSEGSPCSDSTQMQGGIKNGYASVEAFLNIRNKIIGHATYNFKGARIEIPTSYNTDFICKGLAGHKDVDLPDLVRYGWPINLMDRPPKGKLCRNHNSAFQFEGHVSKWVDTNVANGSLLGPLTENPFGEEAFFSPLGTVPKHDPSERRIIMDLSCPHGKAVNDFIPRSEFLGEPYSLRYPRVDNLVNIIKRKGRGCALWKRDLKKAYRQLVWTDPQDVNFLGFRWKGKYYFDLTGPMGLRSSAGACQRTAEGLAYMFGNRNEGAEVVAYQDDVGSADSWDKVWEHYNDWTAMLEQCGIQEAPEKACPPSTVMVFLGILCDSERMVLEVPEDKIKDILDILDEWMRKEEATLKETQSLAGKLAWMSALVIPGRVFLTRIFRFTRGMPAVGRVLVTNDIRKDVYWWKTFLRQFNGVSMMAVEEWSDPDCVFSTDACLSGLGGWFPGYGSFFHKELPPRFKEQNHHISELELLTIAVALKVWGRYWAGQRIIVRDGSSLS